MWNFLLAFIPRAIVQGIPLLYGSTGEIVTEKSGNLNLGIPGVMYVGAICGVIGSFFYEHSIPEGASMNGVLAILIPVGGYYTIDAAQAKAVVDDLAPRVVIPMHYRSDHFGYPVIGRLEEFTGLCRNVVEYDSATLVLTAETRPQTAVLKL